MLDNINDKKVYCKIAYPTNGNNLGAVLHIQSASNTNTASTTVISLFAAKYNVIAISMSGISDVPYGQPGDATTSSTNPDTFGYRTSIAASYQALRYMASRSGLVITQPILCDNSAALFDKAEGYPYYVSKSGMNPGVAAAAVYYDATYAAKRISDPVYFGIGYRDVITHAAGNFAAFNELRGPVHLAHGLNQTHQNHANYFSVWTNPIAEMFFEKYLNGNDVDPVDGIVYFVDAGADKTVAQNETVSLTGTIDAKNASTPSSVEWSCMDCPDIPNFTNANAYTTTATFPTNGTYTLRFGPVYSTGNEANKWYIPSSNDPNLYHTAADYMVVTVGSGSTTLSFNSCPNDISVQAPEGANSTPVNWNTPTASTTCNGSPTISQTEGGNNGSNFNIGTSTVTYQASDNCGNSVTCNFTVTVTSPPPGGSLQINCPNDITVTAASGANGANVPWTEPTATTDCNVGGGCNGSAISGFTYIGELNGSDYYVSQSSQKWTDAKATCENNGGHLVTISSKAENDFIHENINAAVLIGISAENQNSLLEWVTGEPLSYNNWNDSSNQPSVNGENLYGMLNYWTSGGKWEITNYWTSKPFVMEVPCSGGGNSTPTITRTQGPSNGSFFSVGTTTIGYAASDNCNNTDNCTFTVTVLGNPSSALTLNCPADMTVTVPSGASGTTVNWPEPTASTSCGGNAMITQLSALTNGSFLQIGAYILSYEATDNCGNTKNCVFTITVEEGNTGNCNISLPNTCTADLVCVNLSGNVLSVNTNGNSFPVIAIHNADYTVHESLCDFWIGGKPTCEGTLSSSPLSAGNYLLKAPDSSGGNCWIPFTVAASRLVTKETKLNIYPNPVRDVLHITLPENTVVPQDDVSKFIITNTLGQDVQTLPVSGEQVQTLDVSDFAKGIYFIQLKSKDYKIQTAKFMVD